MAVFIALIFQVLFVFFAMVVNIGLIVHDKINLQNSVDLGAYYAAQRQAEMLNEIAHINYAMRQDYKLLAWRMRVLGMLGRENQHPIWNAPSPAPDVLFNDPTITDNAAMCVAHTNWQESFEASSQQNLCIRRPTESIPQVPSIRVIFPDGMTLAVSRIFENFRALFNQGCSALGPLNWIFASNTMLGYRRSNSQRKEMIRVLAMNVSQPIVAGAAGMKDQLVQSVYEGVQKTIRKNLTLSNKNSLVSISAINGLSLGGCGDEVNRYPRWLRPIPINPSIQYINGELTGNSCQPRPLPISQVPVSPIVDSRDPTGFLRFIAQGEPNDPGHVWRTTRGFEKNPWCLAYVGVRAVTRPRKPFSPFGSPIQLEARAFASPFGGRIGPWEGRRWPKSQAFSIGPAVDPLAVPRTDPGTNAPSIDPASLILRIPNHSRFPGDTLGLRSIAALAATRPSLIAPIQAGRRLALAHYDGLSTIETTRDPLAWDAALNAPAPLRFAELAAVAPDLFDATYYSIDPDFFGNYYSIQPLGASRRFDAQTLPLSDLGARLVDPNLNGFGIRQQIRSIATGNVVLPEAYWYIRNPAHLLTGWAQNRANDFGFPVNDFGRCRYPEYTDPSPNPNPTPMPIPAPGDCAQGGRTGYSVRLVHPKFLSWSQHDLGGEAGSQAPLDNPPPADF